MKTALIIRLGAYGDMIMISPVLKKIHEQGYKIILNTGKRGQQLYRYCPHVAEIVLHDETMNIDDLHDHWDKLKEEYKPDLFINFTESIECNVACHPVQPKYIYPKYEREKICNKNYYDATEEWAGIKDCQKTPEVYYSNNEKDKVDQYKRADKFNILWCLSGSGKQKVYPWTDYVIGELLKNFDDINIITVGDFKCKILEHEMVDGVTNLSGELSILESLALAEIVDLVVSPDTAILHAAGCFDTPKIGLLGHTTIENVTKYYKNDFSLEADCACAPCFRLIYDHDVQCPVEPLTRACWCMAEGLPPKRVYEQIARVKKNHKGHSAATLSSVRG